MSVPPVDPIPLPAPEPWLSFLLGLTFLLHLIPMNLVLGCAFVAPVAGWMGRGPAGAAYRTLSRQLTALLPIFLALTITLGVAPLLFLQAVHGRFFFTSSILMGWFWFAVIPLLLAAYSLLYLAAWRRDPRRHGPWVGLLAAALLVLIAFLFTNNMTRMIRPDTFGAVYRANPRGLSLNLSDPTLWPRFLHFLVASLAVTGLFLALMAAVLRRREGEEYASRILRLGSSLFVHPTFLQLLIGPWLLVQLPRGIRSRFLGGSTPETAALGFGVLSALVAMILMVRAPGRTRPGGTLGAAAGAILITLSLMVAARHLLRSASLATARGEAAVASQPLAMAVFAGTLLASLLLVLYMLRGFLASSRPD